MKIDSAVAIKCIADDYHNEVLMNIRATRRARILFYALVAVAVIVADTSIFSGFNLTSTYYEAHELGLFVIALCLIEISISLRVLSLKRQVSSHDLSRTQLKGRRIQAYFDFWLHSHEALKEQTARNSASRFAMSASLLFAVGVSLLAKHKNGKHDWTHDDYALIATALFITSYAIGDFIKNRHIPVHYHKQYLNPNWKFKIWALKELELSNLNPKNHE